MRRTWSWGAILVVLNVAAGTTVQADPITMGWAQPGGPGSAVTITYSYSNLLDGGFNTRLSAEEMRRSTELALGVWTRYAPLNFFELPDIGPAPSDHEYGGGFPDIRIGYQPRLSSGSAAFAYFPMDRFGSEATGLAGDIQFSNDLSEFTASTWGHAHDRTTLDFFSVLLHEIGHALGVAHIFGEPAIMSGSQILVFARPQDAHLEPADIRAIQALYGAGSGFVQPLGGTALTPEPGTIALLITGLGLAWRRMRRIPAA